MAHSTVPATYRKVIEDVIKNVTEDFENAGVESSVLHELQRSWESKLLYSRVADFKAEFGPRNRPFWDESGLPYEDKLKREPDMDMDVKVAEQTDELTALQGGNSKLTREDSGNLTARSTRVTAGQNTTGSTFTCGNDGEEVDMSQPDDQRESSGLREGHRATITRDDGDTGNNHTASKEESDPDAINSDLDDTDEDPNEADDCSGDIVLCQYDKVTHVKHKWRCGLKDGIVNINGKDYIFHRANGDFQW